MTDDENAGLATSDAATTAARRAGVEAAIGNEYDGLLKFAATWVWKLNLANAGESVADLAAEAVAEASLRALPKAHQFDDTRSAFGWLAGYVRYVLMERRNRVFRERERRAAPPADRNGDDAGDWWDRLAETATTDDHRLTELLDLVEPEDQRVIRLAFERDLSGKALAEALEPGLSEGAARVRVSRAVARLRVRYFEAEAFGDRKE